MKKSHLKLRYKLIILVCHVTVSDNRHLKRNLGPIHTFVGGLLKIVQFTALFLIYCEGVCRISNDVVFHYHNRIRQYLIHLFILLPKWLFWTKLRRSIVYSFIM